MNRLRQLLRRARNERGATFVEYAVIFSLLTVSSIAAGEQLGDNATDYVGETANIVGRPYEAPDPALTTTTFPGSTIPHLTTTTTSTTTTTTTTTTIPTTTTTTSAPASTTTTGPTTSTTDTTQPPNTTTTTAVPDQYVYIDTLEDRSTNIDASTWRARVRIRVRDEAGNHFGGAFVTAHFVTADGDEKTKTCTTNTTSGRCNVSWSNRNAADSPVTVTIVSIDSDPAWNGSGPTSIIVVDP